LFVYLILILLSFTSGRLVSILAKDEISDSKKYLKEALFLLQAYILYFLSNEIILLISSYLLFRILDDRAFHIGVFLAIALILGDYASIFLALIFSFLLGLFEYQKNHWKQYAALFLIKIIIIFFIVPLF